MGPDLIGFVPLSEETPEPSLSLSLSLSHVRTQQEGTCLQAKKNPPQQGPSTLLELDGGRPASGTVRTLMCLVGVTQSVVPTA